MTADRRPVALLVANDADGDPGYVGERLEQRGFTLRTLSREHDPLPGGDLGAADPGAADLGGAGLGGADLVVPLGSDWSVHSPVRPAVLDAECALLRAALSAGVPVLAICYGAQVLAHALSGSVALAERPEIGWVTVRTEDPDLVPPGPWLEFHTDVITAPPGARAVAVNGCGLQGFTVPGALAVQFHPEVRPVTLADWVRRFPSLCAAAGVQPAALLAETERRAPQARRAAHALVDGFLDSFLDGFVDGFVDGQASSARASTRP
jgi:GMP synthase-like glutamine amidotransferase